MTPKRIAFCRAARAASLAKLPPTLDTELGIAWAGCLRTSTTGLPAIGALPNTRRCFAILGYGGNGITFSVIAAELIQRAILGVSDPDADLFALSA